MRNNVLRLTACLLLAGSAHAAANLVIVNVDGANEGFNEPMPAAPAGGNPGTTVGQQRIMAFQCAASIWGSKLNSTVPIYIQASFDALSCNATSAILGSAGTIQIWANFPGRELNNTWYHIALANKLAGVDLAPGPNGTGADWSRPRVCLHQSGTGASPLGLRGGLLTGAQHGAVVACVARTANRHCLRDQ
jgi:hypothetical protein